MFFLSFVKRTQPQNTLINLKKTLLWFMRVFYEEFNSGHDIKRDVFSYSASDKEFIKEGILPYSHISTLSPIFTCSKTPVNDSGTISK